ncbi:MAG: hypothetical protein P9L90_02715 [Candidatus Aadella gelida]|nr:hypothetical protein [Candidatus Aadella gelida]
MKSTDVIVGGLILILIVASGAFFMQITEMRHEMELQAREIDEAMRGEDYVPQKEVESFSKEISLRIEGLSEDIDDLREEMNRAPETSGGSDVAAEIGREFEMRFTTINDEITGIQNTVRNLENQINRGTR